MRSPLHSHGLADPHEPQNRGWLPMNEPARELALCIESCKQINELRGMFLFGPPTPRQLTLLTTPLCNLVEHVLTLKGQLHQADRSSWPERDLRTFVALGRSLKRAHKGPLKKIRNTRAAHTDSHALTNGSVPASSAENVLVFLGEAASLLLLCLNHERVYCYYRIPEPNDDTQVEVFFEYPAATTFRVNDQRRLCEILQVHIEADPRYAQKAVIYDTITLYNNLALSCPNLPRIGIQRYVPRRAAV